MPYGDNPDDQTIGSHIYLDMIYEQGLHHHDPYLILNHETVTALQYAAEQV